MEPKPRPAAWAGKRSGEILIIMHEGLLKWVNHPSNGAKAEQREAFTAMLARKTGSVNDLSPEVLCDLPKWELPQGWEDSPVREGSGAKVGKPMEVDASSMLLSKLPPSPDIFYKETTLAKKKKMQDWTEMQRSLTVLPAIPKDSICFVQTVTDERGLEWWFGISQADYPECAASEESMNALVELQWMSVQWKNGNGLVPPNTFEDVVIKPWFERNVGRKKGASKNKKVLEGQPRCAVALMDVTLTKSHVLTETTKKSIVALECGFGWKHHKLVYTWVKEAAARATVPSPVASRGASRSIINK